MVCTSILKLTELAFNCSNSTIYDVNICSKPMLLCKECAINRCEQNFAKITEKKFGKEPKHFLNFNTDGSILTVLVKNGSSLHFKHMWSHVI